MAKRRDINYEHTLFIVFFFAEINCHPSKLVKHTTAATATAATTTALSQVTREGEPEKVD